MVFYKSIIFIIIVLKVSICFAQKNSDEYLVHNSCDIELKDGCKLIIPNDSNVIYLSGETHDSKGNKLLELILFKKLYAENNVRFLLLESVKGAEEIVGKFLLDIDDKRLKSVCLITFNTYDQESIDFFIGLKKFWQSLPSEGKFQVRAVDAESNPASIIYYLFHLLPNINQDSIEKKAYSFSEIRKMNLKIFLPGKRKTLKLLHKIKKENSLYPDLYSNYLGKNYKTFLNMVDAGISGLTFTKKYDSKSLELREITMYQNIKLLLEENPNFSFFGQFGRVHIPISNQKNWLHVSDWESVAARLNTNDDSPAKGKVCSILYYYANIDDKNNYYTESIIKKEDLPLFLKYSSPITLFKLDGENTPFKEMAEKFQYIVINKY